MSQYLARGPGGLLLAALASLAVSVKSEAQPLSLERIFHKASFDSVFPLEKEVVEKYGHGCTRSRRPRCNRWNQ